MENNQQYGALNEQGDLGLGFDVFNESEQKILKDQENKEEKEQE